MVVWPTCSKLWRALSSKRPIAPLDVDIGGILCWRFRLGPARAGGHVVKDDAQKTEQGESAEHGFEEPLPHRVAPRDLGIAWQTPVALGIGGIVEYVDHMGSADELRIVDAGVLPAEIFLQLLNALPGDEFHVVFCAELETTGGTCLDACGFETLADAVGAERALVHPLRRGIEARNIEGATGNAEFAADAVFLVKVDDAVGVLHDGAVGGTSREAAGVGAVHALILAHQPLDRAVRILVLVELDEVPEIPARLGHRLVSIVEGGQGERQVVPLGAGYFARFAADAGGGVDQFADFEVAVHAEAGQVTGGAGMLSQLADAERLKYIEAVTHETMRLKPIAPVLFFEPVEDVEIGGVAVPKNTPLMLPTFHGPLQETHFGAAEKFRPERWLATAPAAGCPHNVKAFVPFGAGPRFCPGRQLAMVEIKTVMAMLCAAFEVAKPKPPSSVREVFSFTMMPENLFVRFHRLPVK